MIGFLYVPSPLSATHTFETKTCAVPVRPNKRSSNITNRGLGLFNYFLRTWNFLSRPRGVGPFGFRPGACALLHERFRHYVRGSLDIYYGAVLRILSGRSLF